MLKVAIACDHAGFEFKQELITLLKSWGHTVDDKGCPSADRVDYPDYAQPVAKMVASGEADRGILVCGTGIGMALAANKVKGVRAASVTDLYSAQMTRQHNDLNVLCLGSRVLGLGKAEALLKIFMETEFEGGRHADRVAKISALEA